MPTSRLLSHFLALALLHTLTRATSSANVDYNNSYPFPRNLHRFYDGKWESPPTASFPFADVPNPSETDQNAPPNGTRKAPNQPMTHDLAFRQRMGFALLTAKNYKSDLSPRVNVVFGELLLRDGPYRSPRDVSLHLIGVYEWATGVLVLIGDVLFEDVQSAVQKLYTAFNDAHTHGPAHSLTAQNITQEAFIQALAPRFTEHRKQFAGSRPNAQRHKGVASQCPFIASFAIARGSYSDSLPQENEYTSLSTGPGAASPGQGVPDPSGASILESARGDVGADIAPGFLSNGVGPPAGAEEHVSEQDEMVRMHGTFESDACKTKMTIELSTLDTDKLFGKAINYTLLVTVVAFAQVIVLIRQMEMTSTQAGARRVSLMTVGLQAVADSYLCLGHLTMGIAVQSLFNAFATAAFFKFICFSIFLMRWMLLIWKARRPSGFSEGWEAMRRELSMLYSRFYGSLLLGIFLLYQMQNHIRLFVFALYAFWVPQIILNVVEDHRRPLLPIYIIATSVTRLAIPLYFWGCPQNFLHIQPQPSSVMALVAWLAIQVIILLSQYKFGPRWFIPKAFLPEKYDYYRPLPMGDEGLEDDIEAQEGTREEDEEGSDKRPLVGGMSNEPKRECCICMESVGVHARDRMVTPCNHFFHAICLERWLEVRLECALCRTAVPPP